MDKMKFFLCHGKNFPNGRADFENNNKQHGESDDSNTITPLKIS